jgi:hypothetical protein
MSKNTNDYVIVTCPHCQFPIYIKHKDFNCHIFRHAVYKHNNQPINPHLSNLECDQLKNRGFVYGCAKPFRLVNKNGEYTAEICDYI